MSENLAQEAPPTRDEIQAILDRSPFIKFCNMRVTEVDPERERIVVVMPMRPELERCARTGQYHGGTIASLIDVYQVGDLYFVKDGHHRVSIAMATGQRTIDAYVTQVLTQVPAQGIRGRRDLVILSEKAGWTYNGVIGGIMRSAEDRWRAA